jgi:Tol biopolymer transport system component
MRRILSIGAILFFVLTINGSSQQLPIQPTRTVSFTTDEGSYMNVDISPDGKTLVFDLLGDLYTLPVNGGEAKQITGGISIKVRPFWSPDGKKIAYLSDYSGEYHLNVVDLKGTFHQVLGKSEPELRYTQRFTWMPGGYYIQVDGENIYGIAGGTLKLKKTDHKFLRSSYDGKYTYYLSSDSIFKYSNETNYNKLITVIDKKKLFGKLSPDGRWWVYYKTVDRKISIEAFDLTNNSELNIVPTMFQSDKYLPELEVRYSNYAFSPDSKSIFTSYGGKIHQIYLETGTAKIIPFVAHVKSDLGTLDQHDFGITYDPFQIKYARSANASPDGRHIVFSALNKIWIKELPDGVPKIVIDQPVSQYQPVYSPDGKWIAYVSWSDTAGGHLWMIPSSGGKSQQLSKIQGNYQWPAWSPDGKNIAILHGVDNPQGIDSDNRSSGTLEVISIKDKAITVLDKQAGLLNKISFTSDGRRVIYQAKKNPLIIFDTIPQKMLISRDLRGENEKLLAEGTYPKVVRQRSLSPDGSYIVYSGAEDLYLVPVIKTNSPQVLYDISQNLPIIRFAEGIDPSWSRDGKTIVWTYGNRYYQIEVSKILKAAELKANSSNIEEKYFVTINVKPDLDVPLDIKVPSMYGKGAIVFRNARIIIMKNGNVLENGDILIRNGRIISVGKSGTIKLPPDAKILGLDGKTVMPGLFDMHLHARVAPDIFPQQSWMYLTSLAYGVTTGCDPALSYDSYGYSELLKAGQMIGPRLFTVGRAVSPDNSMRVESFDDALSKIQKKRTMGGMIVKQYALPTRLQRQWLLLACEKLGLNMTNETSKKATEVVGMIKDGSTGIEHNPEWGEVYKDIILFVAKSKTYLTPTLQVAYGVDQPDGQHPREYFNSLFWKNPDDKLKRFANANLLTQIIKSDSISPDFILPARIDAAIFHSGGHIVMGSHGNDKGVGPHNEIWALQMGGMTNMEALKVATIKGAKALGVQKDLGSLEVGKIADLIILNSNPLDDIHNTRDIKYVMKDGILYDGDTLDQLWPVYKKCPEWKLKAQAKPQ